MKTIIWHGCYDKRLEGLITRKSFAHPAKFSLGLIERIYDHCLAKGYLRRGDIVGDPFGGVATGGIVAAYRGLRWVGVELEEKFVGLARENIALHADKLDQLGFPVPTIVQGDSRKFHLAVDGVITSPPFRDARSDTEKSRPTRHGGPAAERHHTTQAGAGYGNTEGQIDGLKTGSVDVVISSPPYATIAAGAGGLNTKPAKHAGQQSGRKADSASQDTDQRYGQSAGQIAGLRDGKVDAVITSPPYADSINSEKHGIDFTKAKKDYPGRVMHEQRVALADKRHSDQSYGKSDGQIGALHSGDIDAVVSSPPWESNSEGSRKQGKFKDPAAILKCNRGHGDSDAAVLAQAKRDEQKTYGYSEGQIGKEAGETYWQAVKTVYSSCFLAIKPGGVACIVVKDYVSKKKRVPLCDDTARLLEHVGFTIIERIHAMLVAETTHNDLFNGTTQTKVSRKSFFRRLAEKKGSPEINWEEVIIARKGSNAIHVDAATEG